MRHGKNTDTAVTDTDDLDMRDSTVDDSNVDDPGMNDDTTTGRETGAFGRDTKTGGKLDVADQPDFPDRPDAAGQPDFARRPDAADQPDFPGGSSDVDTASRTDDLPAGRRSTPMRGTGVDDTAVDDTATGTTATSDTATSDTSTTTGSMNGTSTTGTTATGTSATGTAPVNAGGTAVNGTADGTAARPVNDTGHHADLFESGDVDKYQDDWRSVQASFVDDPAASVREADALVGRMLDTITSRIAQQRSALSQHHDGGADGEHTEQLRQALRDYRTMFQQLLPSSH